MTLAIILCPNVPDVILSISGVFVFLSLYLCVLALLFLEKERKAECLCGHPPVEECGIRFSVCVWFDPAALFQKRVVDQCEYMSVASVTSCLIWHCTLWISWSYFFLSNSVIWSQLLEVNSCMEPVWYCFGQLCWCARKTLGFRWLPVEGMKRCLFS